MELFVKLKQDNFLAFYSGIYALAFLLLGLVSQRVAANTCSAYLASLPNPSTFETLTNASTFESLGENNTEGAVIGDEANLPKTTRPILGLNQVSSARAYRNILRFKIEHFPKLDLLEEVARYLKLNNVNFTMEEQQIVIATFGASALNRFAQRLALVTKARDQISPTGITKLVFDPAMTKGATEGAFFEDKTYASETSNQVIAASNLLFLSIDAILNLHPTDVEFHELIHWKAYFARSQLDVSSMVHGHIDSGGESVLDEQTKSDQSRSFSLEELQAHLLGLSKLLRRYQQATDSDDLLDLGFEIKSEMLALSHYAAKTKPLLEEFFRKSIFKDFKDGTNSFIDLHGLVLSKDFVEVINFDWFEEISDFPGQGQFSNQRALEYQFASQLNYSWIYLIIPIPESFKDLNDYRKLSQIQHQKAFNDLGQSIYEKMVTLLKLIHFIEGLNLKIDNDETIAISPIEYFHELDRELLAKLNNF